MLPTAICALMFLFAAIVAARSSLDFTPLFAPYLSSALAISFLSVLTYAFIEVAKLARMRADDPLAMVWRRLADRALLLLLPAIVLPLFLVSYTASKCAIQFLVGYGWDPFFANADRLIFGEDVWRLTRRLLGSSHSRAWEWFYTAVWGGAFFVIANAVALFASKRFVGIYFSAMLASWFVGGCVLAYCFSAAGPVFAGLFHPELVQRFMPMHRTLQDSLGPGPISFTQQYLTSIVGLHVAIKGGGISAMPSMHIASTSIYVMAARRTGWLIPALLFWIIIFVASGYFGYHYWVDGLAAAVLAGAIWRAGEALFATAPSGSTDLSGAPVPPAAAAAR